jgi:hypothetical protein
MRVFFYIWSLLAVLISAGAAETNSEYLTFTYQSRHQDFEWHFYFSRMLATPEWNMDTLKIPLAPDKAWCIAKKWFKKYGCDNPELVSIDIRPFIIEQYTKNDKIDSRLSKRFYYCITCVPEFLDSMKVYVLMDGTVVEPIQEPRKGLWSPPNTALQPAASPP